MTRDTRTAPGPAVQGRKYWRGMDELADTPEFRKHVEAEFPSVFETGGDGVSRRKFIGLMGAAIAMSGLVGCRRPLAKILPYSKLPEDLLPGVPQSYATVFPFRGFGEGILVTSNEGRPNKIEGNPDHPSSLGATHSWAQASILSLYDPDRSRTPSREGAPSDWASFEAWMGEALRPLRASGGAGLRFLGTASASPTVRALRAEVLRAFPEARWVTYEPVHRDAVIAGGEIAFGQPVRTQLQLDQADVILSLDSDFLLTETNSVRHARDFAKRRRVTSEKDTMNRLYMVESAFSVTGTMADHRLRFPHFQIADIARALAFKLRRAHGLDLAGVDPGTVGALGEYETWITALAKDLADHRGRCVILAGASQPAEVHALVHALNQSLGNVGPVVRYTREPHAGDQTGGLRQLTEEMGQGTVSTLVILDGNPVFDAPADLEFPARLEKVANRVHAGLYEDETSAACTWHLPLAHYLETWGDAEAYDGTLSIQQPLIAPLYEGRSELEILSLILSGVAADGHAVLTDRYTAAWGLAGFEGKWNRALHDGRLAGSAFPELPVAVNGDAVTRAFRDRANPGVPGTESLEVVFRPDLAVWDGSFANNGWLQELPDNMTKLTWDNAALMSPRTARDLGLASGDMVTLSAGGRELTLAAMPVPGLADFSIQLPLGYGRTRAGRVGDGVGFDVYPFRTSDGMSARSGVRAAKAAGTYQLVTTQTHHTMEGRPLVREASLEEYREEPEFATEAVEVPPLVTLYNREYDYAEGHQWGMSIDLNTCIGCNACAIACQSENNIAIVGKDQVHRGREMHWIRIDRYYTGEEEDPEAVHQPVPCMQCENAPCESVCPVNATSHSDEGLNQMTYNRCIGTRYCNNNCPYKVRRFNYYNWRQEFTEVEKMAMNPDVTVRMRGVMEKCTYCVQRINRVKIDAKNAGRDVRDGEIRTACQQVCPTGSIVFGDINDPGSQVSQLKEQNRDYTILEELNTRPRTTYLARIRNPNPELEHTS